MTPWTELLPYAAETRLKRTRVNLFYYDTGSSEKPVCILLHGLADEADTWRHLISPLADHYRVIAPDLPGFGRSSKPRRSYTMEYLGRVIIEMMDKLEIHNAHFIGSSLGAMLIQYLGVKSPCLIKSQTLVDGVLSPQKPRKNFSSLLFMTPGLGEHIYSRLRKDNVEAYGTLKPFYSDLDSMPREDRDFMFQRVHDRVSDKGQRFAYFSILRKSNSWLKKAHLRFRESLASSEIPVLMIWGEDDHIIPLHSARSMQELLQNAELVLLKGAGHLPQQEKPQEVLDSLLPWLKKFN